jgi:hypothetical protein
MHWKLACMSYATSLIKRLAAATDSFVRFNSSEQFIELRRQRRQAGPPACCPRPCIARNRAAAAQRIDRDLDLARTRSWHLASEPT